MNLGELKHGTTFDRPTESILGTGYQLLVDSESTGGAYELMKFVVPAGLGPPKHKHTREDEHYYILEGKFDVMVGEKTIVAGPGTFLHLPRDVPHGLINVGQEEGSFLCWVIPGNLGALFDRFKKPWPAEQKFPPVLKKADILEMTRLGNEFGISTSID